MVGGGAGQPAARVSAGTAGLSRQSAISGPILARGAAGRRRSLGPAHATSTGGGSRHSPVVSAGVRGTTCSRGSRAVAGFDGAHRRAGDRQDDNGRAAVGAVRRTGGTGRQGAAAHRTGGADREGRGQATRGGATRD